MIPPCCRLRPRCPNRIIIAYPANRCRDPKTVEKGANVRLIIRPLDVPKKSPTRVAGRAALARSDHGSGRTPGAAVAYRASEHIANITHHQPRRGCSWARTDQESAMPAQPAPASQPLPHQPQQLPAYGSDLERRAGCPEFPPVRAGKLDCPAPRFARPVRTARAALGDWGI